MTTALATTQSRALQRFGGEEEIHMLMQRQAAIFSIPEDDLDRPDVQASLVKATQYSIAYGYLPGIHIHMIPFNRRVKIGNSEQWVKTYQPDMGEKAWKDSADRQAFMGKFRYLVETEELPQDEVKRLTAEDASAEYDPADKGFRARVLRTDHADLCRELGRPYEPTWSYGFWRKKARKKNNGQWESDTVPTGRMTRDVAERRAYKAALMKVFSLVPLNDYEESQRYKQLSAYVEEESATVRALPHSDALPADDDATRDDDDLLLWGEDPSASSGQAYGHYRHVDTETGEILEEVIDDEPACPESAEGFPTASTKVEEREAVKPDIDYAGVVGSLGENCRKFANWCRVKHLNSDGPCTGPQYGLLQGTINDLTGEQGSHYAILHVLIGRSVDSKNPPGFDLVSALLDWLIEETGPKNAKVKNPNYKEEYAQCILSIHRAVREALGQLELPLAA